METVIIGSGKTGRGFIAPFLHRNQCNITFIDKDKELIGRLTEESKYTVHYFGEEEKKYEISDYNSYSTDDNKAINALINADIVFTSIYANNLTSITDILEEAIDKRIKKSDLIIICCENGINVKQPLLDNGLKAIISEGIIFCTTIEMENSLDLISETYPELPVDNIQGTLQFNLTGIKQIDNFSDLIKRKIYTYNFMSALIAYLGDYKGYEMLSRAANDSEIDYLIDKVISPISSSIAKEFDITYGEQIEFMMRAVEKFKNPQITDSIERNVIQVERKLSSDERLLKPFSMLEKHKKNNNILLLIIAVAINYGKKHENLNEDEQFKKLLSIMNEDDFNKMKSLLKDIQTEEKLLEIIWKLKV